MKYQHDLVYNYQKTTYEIMRFFGSTLNYSG